MKRKSKPPTKLTNEEKHLLKAAKAAHAFACDLEIFMSQLQRMLEADQRKDIDELHTEIKALHVDTSKTRHRLGEGLTALGMLPHNPKPAKRTASTLSK